MERRVPTTGSRAAAVRWSPGGTVPLRRRGECSSKARSSIPLYVPSKAVVVLSGEPAIKVSRTIWETNKTENPSRQDKIKQGLKGCRSPGHLWLPQKQRHFTVPRTTASAACQRRTAGRRLRPATPRARVRDDCYDGSGSRAGPIGENLGV